MLYENRTAEELISSGINKTETKGEKRRWRREGNTRETKRKTILRKTKTHFHFVGREDEPKVHAVIHANGGTSPEARDGARRSTMQPTLV